MRKLATVLTAEELAVLRELEDDLAAIHAPYRDLIAERDRQVEAAKQRYTDRLNALPREARSEWMLAGSTGREDGR